MSWLASKAETLDPSPEFRPKSVTSKGAFRSRVRENQESKAKSKQTSKSRARSSIPKQVQYRNCGHSIHQANLMLL